MNAQRRDSEQQRREIANQNRDDIVPGSERPVTPRYFPTRGGQMINAEDDPERAEEIRQLRARLAELGDHAHDLAPRLYPHYWSTACQHLLHDGCRKTCKFCDLACQCLCHVPAREPVYVGERGPERVWFPGAGEFGLTGPG